MVEFMLLLKRGKGAFRFLVYSEDNPYTAHAAGALALSGATKEAKRSFSYLGFSSLRFIFRPPPTAYYEANKSVLFKYSLSVTLSVLLRKFSAACVCSFRSGKALTAKRQAL